MARRKASLFALASRCAVDGDDHRALRPDPRRRRLVPLTYGHFAPPDLPPSPTETLRGTLQLSCNTTLGCGPGLVPAHLHRLPPRWRCLPLGVLMGASSRSTASSSRSCTPCATSDLGLHLAPHPLVRRSRRRRRSPSSSSVSSSTCCRLGDGDPDGARGLVPDLRSPSAPPAGR